MPKPVAAPTPAGGENVSPDDKIADSIGNILGSGDDPGAGGAPDGGAPAPDGGAPAPDGGAPAPDGGAPAPDGGAPAPDGGAPAPDGGEPDGGAPTPPAEGAIPDVISGVAAPTPDGGAPAPDGDDDDPPPEDAKSGKGKNAWSKIKAEKKELKERVASLEQQLEQANGQQTPEMQDVLNMKKQLEEKENLIGQLDVTRTQAFQSKFDMPMEQTLRRGEAILVKAGTEPEAAKLLMLKMVNASNAQEMSDMVADQPVALQGALVTVVSEYEQLVDQRKAAVENWRETQMALEHNENRSEEIKLAENIENDTAAAVEAAVAEGNFLFTKTGGQNEDWDKAVDARTQLVKGILHTSKPAELVKWVVEGVTAKDVRDAYLAERNKVIELTQKLNSVTVRAPAVGAGATPAAPAAPSGAPRSPDQVIGGIFTK